MKKSQQDCEPGLLTAARLSEIQTISQWPKGLLRSSRFPYFNDVPIAFSQRQFCILHQKINVSQRPEIILQRPEIISHLTEIISHLTEIISQRPEIILQRPEIISKRPEIISQRQLGKKTYKSHSGQAIEK